MFAVSITNSPNAQLVLDPSGPHDAESSHPAPLPFQPTFATQTITAANGGFQLQFAISNPNRAGQFDLYSIVPVILFRYYHVSYHMVEPARLSSVTVSQLRQIKREFRGDILESGDGVFAGSNIVTNRVYRLSPSEIETFIVQFIIDPDIWTTWAMGFVLKFSDSTGNKSSRTSDLVYVFTNEKGIKLAAYNERELSTRLSNVDQFDFYRDLRLDIKSSGAWMLMQGSRCPWARLFAEGLRFLDLKAEHLEEMTRLS